MPGGGDWLSFALCVLPAEAPLGPREGFATWCTHGSPKPWAAPSPESMKPQLQSRGSGGPFNTAWRCSLEERSLRVPRIKVVPILMHFSQTFQNRKGQHFVIVNDVLFFSVLKVIGIQRREIKIVITEHTLTLSSIYLGCDKRWSTSWLIETTYYLISN